MKKTKKNKTIEQLDYELKARKKFPSDGIHPITEQSKQKVYDQSKQGVTKGIDKKRKNIEERKKKINRWL